MPWINQDDCIGCEICVEICPVDCIYMEDSKAVIDLKNCIRCGKCHEVCPQDAARHDSEKIPEEVEENINWVKDLLEYYETEEERVNFMHRINKHFIKEKTVIEKTMARLETLIV